MTTYNGWINYETWLTNLWLSEEDYERYLKDFINDFDDVYDLRDHIEDYVEENNPLADQCSMYADLLSNALREVDYREIAENYWEELRYEDDDEDEDETDEELLGLCVSGC